PPPGPPGRARPARGRSRARPREEGDREEGVGREDPLGAAPRGTMGDEGDLRVRAVPAEVRLDELEAPRPRGPRAHREEPADPEGGGPVPPEVRGFEDRPVPLRRPRVPRERGVLHGECGPDARPVRVPEGSPRPARDRLARPPPEEGRRVALLPLEGRDPRLLGGALRVRRAPAGIADPRHRTVDRAGSRVLPRAEPVPRRSGAVSTVVPSPLPRALLLRHPRRPGRPHVPRLRRRPADAPRPRPAREDAEPGRELEHGCAPPGHGGSRVPGPGSVLPPRPRGRGTA